MQEPSKTVTTLPTKTQIEGAKELVEQRAATLGGKFAIQICDLALKSLSEPTETSEAIRKLANAVYCTALVGMYQSSAETTKEKIALEIKTFLENHNVPAA